MAQKVAFFAPKRVCVKLPKSKAISQTKMERARACVVVALFLARAHLQGAFLILAPADIRLLTVDLNTHQPPA